MRFSRLALAALACTLFSGPSHSLPDEEVLVPKTNTTEPLSQAEAIRVCKSREFGLVVENWFVSEATEWLQNYTRKNRYTDNYKKRGVVGAIAYDYLGDTGMVCGTNTASLCQVDCVNVIKSIPDVLEAQKIYFVLKSAQHLNLIFDTVRRDLTTAQSNVALLAPSMAKALHWSEKSDHERTHDMLVKYLSLFVQIVLGSVTAWVPGSSILTFAEESWKLALTNVKALKEKLRRVDTMMSYRTHLERLHEAEREVDRRRGLYYRILDTGERKSYADERWYQAVSPWIGALAPRVAFDALTRYISFDGAEDSVERNTEKLLLYLKGTGEFTRRRLGDGVDELFKGIDADGEGATSFSKLVGSGGYLPSTSEALSLWTGPEVEEKLTRNFMLKALDSTLKSQEIWITCTKDFKTVRPRSDSTSPAKYPTNICPKDMSGPQDLKECVGGYVCYMYKWMSRSGAYPNHRVEYPFGMQDIKDVPYDVDPKDIIHSSVMTYMEQHRQNTPPPETLSLASFKDAASSEKVWDARQPGFFTVPVCMSQYNFNTPIEPMNKASCFFDLNCRQKTLPCNCGPYGSETKPLWKEVGLWDLPSVKHYRKGHCSRQIRNRIKDGLERYAAYCGVEIHNTFAKYKFKSCGAHVMCGTVLEQLKKADYPPSAIMSPTLKTKLLCMAGKISKKMCAQFGVLNQSTSQKI